MVPRNYRPRLADEWQLAPHMWNAARHHIDHRSEAGQFILTGSAVPADDVTRHSGAGRFLRMRMRPMSLFESGHSSGAVSLAELLEGEPPRASGSGLPTLPALVDQLCRGGWPALQGLDDIETAIQANVSYLNDIARVDIPATADDAAPSPRNPARLTLLLAALARNIATEAAATTLARDVSAADDPIKSSTVARYLAALERVHVVEDQPSWTPHLRSRDTVRRAAKRHLVDPSLAVAALNATPAALLADFELLGLLFESLTIRDLRIFAQHLGGVVQHYRDSRGQEVDAIVTGRNGTWAAFEVKLNRRRTDEAAASLVTFAEKVDTSRSGAPAALTVITTGDYAYRRPDGVNVVPLALLGP